MPIWKHLNRSKFALKKVKLKLVASVSTFWMELFRPWIVVNLTENSVCNIRLLDRGKNFKRRSLSKLKMSVTLIYRFLNWIAPCKVLLVSTVLLESFPVTLKTTTQGTFESMSMSIKITWFFHISYHYISNCSLQWRLCTFQFFFFIFTWKTFASSYRKMYLEMRRVKNC